jgi:hypothetical protein
MEEKAHDNWSGAGRETGPASVFKALVAECDGASFVSLRLIRFGLVD